MKYALLFILPFLIFITACKDKNGDGNATYNLTVAVASYDGAGANFPLSKKGVVDGSTEISLSTMKLYLSDISLTDNGGKIWKEKNSYHLLQLGAGSNKINFQLKEVPAGSYAKLTYTFGVDSAHNHNLTQIGDLDPANGMAWDWNTGYRFLVMEGAYYAGADSGALIYHVGTDANARTKTLTFSTTFTVSSSDTKALPLRLVLTNLPLKPNNLLPIKDNNDIMHDSAQTAKLATNMVEAVISVDTLR